MVNLARTLMHLRTERGRVAKELYRLDEAIAALRKVAGNNPGPARTRKPHAKSRLSAATRKKISAAQKKRWAKLRKAKTAKK